MPTKRNINSWKLDKEIRKSLIKLIDRRRENSNSANNNNNVHEKCPKDLLGLMIQASNSSPSSNITVNDIVEECKSFFFAGKQTTSNLLTWTTVLLAMHPQWQLQARAEVQKMCGARDIPTKDDVVKLKTVSQNQTLDYKLGLKSCFVSLPMFFSHTKPNRHLFFALFFFFFFWWRHLLLCVTRFWHKTFKCRC